MLYIDSTLYYVPLREKKIIIEKYEGVGDHETTWYRNSYILSCHILTLNDHHIWYLDKSKWHFAISLSPARYINWSFREPFGLPSSPILHLLYPTVECVYVALVLSCAMATSDPREHVEEIRRVKFSIGGDPNPLTQDLHFAVRNLSSELYTKDVHFLLELIQLIYTCIHTQVYSHKLVHVFFSSTSYGHACSWTIHVFRDNIYTTLFLDAQFF